MNNNYYSSLYPARAVLTSWIEDDKAAKETPAKPTLRKIVFVNSTASLVPLPGYLAYSGKSKMVEYESMEPQHLISDFSKAAKCAQRALADTLRIEVTRYNNSKSTYSVQCIFAHNFITPTFIEEQKHKPDLTKRFEGTTGELKDLEQSGKFPYAAEIASELVDAVAKGDFAVMDGRFEPQMCWGVSVGSSPKRGWGVWDTCLSVLASLAWPLIRRTFEKDASGEASHAFSDEAG